MKRCRLVDIASIAVIVSLSACVTRPEPPSSAGEVSKLGLTINGEQLDKALLRSDSIESIFSELFDNRFDGGKGREELGDLLQAIERGEVIEADVPALNGICGYSTAQFLHAVLFPEVKRKEKGLIGDFLFDPNSKSGHLTVDTMTEIFSSKKNYEAGQPDETIRLQWHIEVLPNTYEVHNIDYADPLDPFPGTVPLPADALNPKIPGNIWERGLDHKLFAKGQKIVVHDIFQQIGSGSITRLPNGHVFYKPCDHSCIDLLTKDYPPLFRIDFPKQSGYCLGRCSHPYIFNSK